jgi:hypothetical protein
LARKANRAMGSKPRFTVRALIGLIAVFAVGLWLARDPIVVTQAEARESKKGISPINSAN